MKISIKEYVKMARAAGYPVSRSVNGHGWIRVAVVCGATCETKREARTALHRILVSGLPPSPAPPRKIKAPKLQPPIRREPKPVFATSDGFLMSYEWRRVRMEALKKHGARCQCCGATPSDGVKMNVDHIKPRRLFPQLALDVNNLQVLCNDCNHGKGNWDMTDWRQRPEELTPEQAQHMKDILS